MQTLTHDADVTVIGGGPAGVAAAIAAARNGARVALINNRPVLGGNSSSEVRVWIVGATSHGAQKFARETGIMGELFLENQWRNPEGNPILWDHVVLDAVRAEENISLFLNTDVREVAATGPEGDRTIETVTGWQTGSEKLITFSSPIFIDCTGDGLVGHLAGARYMSGREDRAAFAEPWAPETADTEMLGSTILFYTKDTGAPVRFVPPGITKDIVAAGIPIHRHIDTAMNGCDYWWIEWGGELDAVDDNEAIRDELWGVVFGIWDHIKNSGEFDADTLTLEWVGTMPGKREYRRFVGDHVLTQHDILGQTGFTDNIGFGGWSIDLHPPGGVYSDAAGSRHLHGPGLYEIPFRSLYSVNVSNMLMAGRDISATHVAFGTTRVMATCAVTGEAAGTGAALAARHGVTPREIGRQHLTELQSTLVRQDASVVGVPWTDDADLALSASVSASSTLRVLEVAAGDEALPIGDRDFALLLPLDPRLDTVRIGVEAVAETIARVELWGTGNGMNHIPVDHVATLEVRVAQGRGVLEARFDHTPDAPADAVVIVRRNDDLSILVGDERPPYGVLGLLAREPGVLLADPQTNEWSAAELRRRSPRFEVRPDTAAYRPANVAGGFARPFGGPQLWASERAAGEEWIELRWDTARTVARIELVFNDDVDEDLINLHHHTTPFLVMPELVRDYRVEARVGGAWQVLTEVAGNRRRRRIHGVDQVITDAVRVVVTATNGDPRVMIAAVRVFES
ncbi:FAD-dependent oxidoreductase [Microbacterium bovistercoris]|uniref:FAD-dependent oxidoreductase n=1 Tax=Microbacterium bovistercoris TaxID=2293570 RepID=A0A371NV89_9MICO|nr:FAD-dependent oxidoreductase [Microbacterium bovistercoris]REJ06467.1 FAD-dependent oxidoreductase [Microbacterium bovistercoris]